MLRQVETTLLSPAFFVSNHLSINFLDVLSQYHFRKKVYLKPNMQTCLLPNINENKSFVPKINISQQDNSLTAGNNLILFSPIKKKSELTNTKSWKSHNSLFQMNPTRITSAAMPQTKLPSTGTPIWCPCWDV